MKMLLSLLLSSLITVSSLVAEPAMRNCHCLNCKCTPEKHCGCYSDQGCHCDQSCQTEECSCNMQITNPEAS